MVLVLAEVAVPGRWAARWPRNRGVEMFILLCSKNRVIRGVSLAVLRQLEHRIQSNDCRPFLSGQRLGLGSSKSIAAPIPSN